VNNFFLYIGSKYPYAFYPIAVKYICDPVLNQTVFNKQFALF